MNVDDPEHISNKADAFCAPYVNYRSGQPGVWYEALLLPNASVSVAPGTARGYWMIESRWPHRLTTILTMVGGFVCAAVCCRGEMPTLFVAHRSCVVMCQRQSVRGVVLPRNSPSGELYTAVIDTLHALTCWSAQGACLVAFPECDASGNALAVCASFCIDELMTCRTLSSAFGPMNVVEALCNDQEPHTVANEDGTSGLCSSGRSLHELVSGVVVAAPLILILALVTSQM